MRRIVTRCASFAFQKTAPRNVKGAKVRELIPVGSIALTDFLIGLGILLVFEGILFLGFPGWMRRAMKSALASPDSVLRLAGIISAVGGLLLIWFIRR